MLSAQGLGDSVSSMLQPGERAAFHVPSDANAGTECVLDLLWHLQHRHRAPTHHPTRVHRRTDQRVDFTQDPRHLLFLGAHRVSAATSSVRNPLTFAVRVIACIVPEVIYRRQAYSSDDFTFAVWPAVVCAQFVASMSIVTASVPYLQPFFKSLQSGMIRTDDTRRRDGTTILGNYRSKKSSHWSGGGGKSLSNRFPSSESGAQRSSRTKTLELGSWAQASRPDGVGKTTIDVVGGQTDKAQWETESQGSQSHIIRQTTTWVVDHEDEDRSST